MRKETESQWRAKLDEAREELSEIRGTLISSWLNIHSIDNKDKKDERILSGGFWAEAVREEIELTKKVIAPAKKQLGLPLTNIDQEISVKIKAGEISQMYGGTSEEGIEIAERHIRFTKKIQKRLGVKD